MSSKEKKQTTDNRSSRFFLYSVAKFDISMEKIMSLRKKVLIISAILLSAVMAVVGCEKKTPEPPVESEKQEPQPPKFEFAGEEIYGNPDIFSTPRIQFAWRPPGFPSKEIWSMRLDGSDLRRAVKAELLYAEKATGFRHAPVRSPDNRYIIISMSTEDTIQKHLIDLKTQTKTVIMTGGVKPDFTWYPDSKRVMFYSDPGLLEYNIETKELKNVKDFDSFNHFILKDGRFAVVTKKGVSYYSSQRKFIRAIDIFNPDEIGEDQYDFGFFNRISWDGRNMVYELGNMTRFIALDNPGKIIFSTSKRIVNGAYGPDGGYFYHSIGRLDLRSGERIRLLDWECIDGDCGGTPTDTTLFNLKVSQ